MFEVALFLYFFHVPDLVTLYPPVKSRSPEMQQRMADLWPVGETSSIPSDKLKREADYEDE